MAKDFLPFSDESKRESQTIRVEHTLTRLILLFLSLFLSFSLSLSLCVTKKGERENVEELCVCVSSVGGERESERERRTKLREEKRLMAKGVPYCYDCRRFPL